jgi:hypothetical protein
VSDTDERQQALAIRPYFTDNFTVDRHAGPRDTLRQNSHDSNTDVEIRGLGWHGIGQTVGMVAVDPVDAGYRPDGIGESPLERHDPSVARRHIDVQREPRARRLSCWPSLR